jgi:hypothetical protein
MENCITAIGVVIGVIILTIIGCVVAPSKPKVGLERYVTKIPPKPDGKAILREGSKRLVADPKWSWLVKATQQYDEEQGEILDQYIEKYHNKTLSTFEEELLFQIGLRHLVELHHVVGIRMTHKLVIYHASKAGVIKERLKILMEKLIDSDETLSDEEQNELGKLVDEVIKLWETQGTIRYQENTGEEQG